MDGAVFVGKGEMKADCMAARREPVNSLWDG